MDPSSIKQVLKLDQSLNMYKLMNLKLDQDHQPSNMYKMSYRDDISEVIESSEYQFLLEKIACVIIISNKII